MKQTNTKNYRTNLWISKYLFTKTLLIALFILIAVPLVSAERFVNYNAFEGIIEQNGDFEETTNQIDNFNVLGFECLNEDCSELGDELWPGVGTTNNQITLTYPTNDVLFGFWPTEPEYGYAVYFYKDGYISYEHKSFFYGTVSGEEQNPYGPIPVYLSKKQGCHSPIEDLKVANEIYPNMPLMIDVKTNIDSKTYSALSHAGPLEAVPTQLEDFYNADTKIILEIFNKDNQIVYTETKEVQIEASGSQTTHFEWIPKSGQTGEYTIKVSTEVTDEMCENPIKQSSQKTTNVVEDASSLEDSCYTLLNNLQLSDPSPEIGEQLTVSANKISNYVTANGELNPVSTLVELELFTEDNQLIPLYTEVLKLAANQEPFNSQSFNTQITLNDAGKYKIKLTGLADSQLCNGKENLPDFISTLTIVEQANTNTNHAPILNFYDDVELAKDDIRNFDLNLFAQDLDLDALTFRVVAEPDNQIVDYTLTDNILELKGNQRGSTSMTIEVSDGELSDQATFTIAVTEGQLPNDAPTITSIPNREAKINTLYQYQVIAEDNDTLQYYFEQAPKDMTINSTTGLIEWTPKKAGSYRVRLSVTDGLNTVTQSYLIEVTTEPSKKHLFAMSSDISAINPIAKSGKYTQNYILLRNIGQIAEKNIDITVTLPKLGFSQQIIKDLTLGPHDTKWVPLMFKIPENAEQGKQLMVVEFENKYYKTQKYGTLTIERPEENKKYLIV